MECLLWLSERFGWLPWQKGYAVLTAVAAVGATMVVMFVWCAAALCFRWWFQFHIRALLVLVVVVAVPCSWVAVEVKKARRQSEVVAWIKSLDSSAVLYDWEFDAKGKSLPNARPPAPEWLWNLLGVDFFSDVLQAWLNDTDITDNGLEQIKSFTHLQLLSLQRTPITDAGLKHIKGLMRLQSLYLDNTRVTDAGLENVQDLTQLQDLQLEFTLITGSGLDHLRGLSQLRLLDIRYTNVSHADARKLQRALPNCRIAEKPMRQLYELYKRQPR